MAASEDVDVRLRLQGALRFSQDANRSARAIDNIGDQASQAARKIARFNSASSKTRLNIGPFSTSMRGGALAVGAFALTVQSAVPAILSAAEAVATLAGGAGAAGGVGLLALGQAAGVAKLGMSDLMDALGGNAAAAKRLTPEMRELFNTLTEKQTELRSVAQAGLMPGLTRGAVAASRNFKVLRDIVSATARTLGGLASDAGGLLGSAAFGRDARTVGRGNVQIINNLGHAGLSLASALRHILVEATPLAVWISKMVEDGAHLIDVWAENARQSGKMAAFFREARRDLSLLASIGGHTGRGLINLFGSQDVDGTKALSSLDKLSARFERWSRSPEVLRDVGAAVVTQIERAAGAALTKIAETVPRLGAKAAEVFVKAFLAADIWGKLAAGAWLTKKLGGFSALRKILAGGGLGKGAGPLAALAGRGASPANPVFVKDVGIPGVGGGGPGGGGRAGWLKKLLPTAAGSASLLPAAATVGGLLGAIKLAQNQHGPKTPIADRNAAARQFRNADPQTFHVPLDAQGFPTGGIPKPQPIVLNNTLMLDGNVVAKRTTVAKAKRKARQR